MQAVVRSVLVGLILACGTALKGWTTPAPSLTASSHARVSDDATTAALSAKVDQLFSIVDPRTAPGCAVAVIKDGRIVHKKGYGLADLDHDIPITPATVFQVGSIAKQFTATAILLLAQDGKLSLDDEVKKHIAEFPDFGERVTIRHLLHHTSGVRDQLQLLALTGWRYTQDLITDEDVLELVARQKALNFKPGTQHLYSNTGYTLLAQIVKRVSGQSFREFTTKRIFEPLGMTPHLLPRRVRRSRQRPGLCVCAAGSSQSPAARSGRTGPDRRSTHRRLPAQPAKFQQRRADQPADDRSRICSSGTRTSTSRRSADPPSSSSCSRREN